MKNSILNFNLKRNTTHYSHVNNAHLNLFEELPWNYFQFNQ